MHVSSFNRTFMELKQRLYVQIREVSGRFNRTFMELKPSLSAAALFHSLF